MDKVREILKPMILVWLLFSVSTAMAQGSQVKTLFSIKSKNTIAPQCYSDELHDKLMRTDEAYKQRHESLERQIQTAVSHASDADRDVVHTIPLVVHVIHVGEPVGQGSNISDEQVFSAVAALNEDFRKITGSNGDGAGADVEIEFCLAVRDPNGNPTNGINRINGSSVPNYATMGIASFPGSGADEQAVKALSNWSKWDYYNIWVVSEIGDNDGGAGTQGYAYFPSAGPTVDGTVILHNAFGTVGNLKGYTNMNRTLTHELGHGLNLYHTFEGNNCSESNCSTQGDRVCDTPPTTQNSNCNSPACGGTQQVENYMDYTSQTCKDMFSEGQKSRMRLALTTMRSTLLNSEGCTPVTQVDAGIDEIITPSGNACNGSITPIVKVRNFGGNSITSLTINYGIDGSSNTFNYSGNIASGGVQEITLPTITTGVGAHNFSVSTASPNGQADEFPANDSMTSNFDIVTGSTLTVTVRQDTYGSNTTWELLDGNGGQVAIGGPYENGESGTVHTRNICLPEDCYTFTIFDSYGDGLIGSAYYEVTDSEEGLIVTGSDFAFSETTNFCTEGAVGGGTAPEAEFTANMTTACAGESINFTDLSTGSPNSWQWNFEGATNNASSNQNPTNIVYNTPGVYDVTLIVGNSNGTSTETKTNFITIGDGPTVNGTVTHVSCYGDSDGVINLDVTGGQPGYNYSWSNGANTADNLNLIAGTYSVLVSDGNGCESMHFYSIESPTEIQLSITNNTPDVDNAGVGSASISVTGGVPPYQINWSNGTSGTTLSNVQAGAYTATVVDDNGCISSITVSVSNQDSGNTESPVANFAVDNNEVCALSTVNFVDQSTNNPTSWAWEFEGGTPTYSSNMNPTGIRYDEPGEYYVKLTVTNAFGSNIKTEMNYIHTLETPIVMPNVTAISCNGNQDGGIDLSILGGQSPYAVNWSNGSTNEDLLNLTAGNYTAMVTDANGCLTSSTITMVEPTPILISVIGNQPDSCGMGQGTVTVIPSGGTPDYTVAWNDDQQQTGGTLSNVLSGSYVAVVTDAHNCTKGVSIDIAEIDCGTVGINEIELNPINVYPNPSTGNLINLTYESMNTVTAELYNVTGSTVDIYIQKEGSNSFTVRPKSKLTNGIYLLKIIDGGQSIIKKIVVKN